MSDDHTETVIAGDQVITYEPLCRSDYYADTGTEQGHNGRIVRCNLPADHDGDHDEMIDGEAGVVTWPRRDELPAIGSFVDTNRTDLEASLRRVIRERDSLARRCAQRYEETEKLRAELASARAEGIREGREQVEAKYGPLVEAAKELPTDHVLSVLADFIADVPATFAGKRAFWQAVFDEVKAFEELTDALASLTPDTEETTP